MPNINYFWLGYYKNGMQLKGFESIKNIPNLEDIKLLEVYIKDKEGNIRYHLGVGLDSGFFYINSEKIDPAPAILNVKPIFRPIFFMVKQRHFQLFPDGNKKAIEDDFYIAGVRVGWQTTIEGKNYQRMMTWMEGWDRIAIMSKRV